MATRFDPDPVLCVQYAQFAAGMEGWQYRAVYWSLFASNLVLLFLASCVFIKAQSALEKCAAESDERSRALHKSMLLCLICVAFSTAIVVIETFMLLGLQFCDGENLMTLYWASWTIMQIGTVVAIIGIMIALVHSLRRSKPPPWGLALGTPILIAAGLMNLLQDLLRRKPKQGDVEKGDEQGPPFSQQNTLRAATPDELDKDMHVELIGLTIDGGPIVRFTEPLDDGSAPKHGELLGYCDEKKPIVAYRQGEINLMPPPEVLTR
ncbi:hypothetical protein CDD81_3219 [Ophiocordyceps australis]|uniref:Uncharacterized protein n=1 Tax=Ophiocordyceps australis TaxID=1399860 RepID=A0A2C5X7B2_9HYPO|nr:hypothetical protein CDD81_3219 [Ophiocordyceps australis]